MLRFLNVTLCMNASPSTDRALFGKLSAAPRTGSRGKDSRHWLRPAALLRSSRKLCEHPRRGCSVSLRAEKALHRTYLLGNRADLVRFRDMLVAARDSIAPLKGPRGLQLEDVVARRPTRDLDPVWGGFVEPTWASPIVSGRTRWSAAWSTGSSSFTGASRTSFSTR